LEYVPPTAPNMGEDGVMAKLSIETRVFLGTLAGPVVVPGYIPGNQQTAAMAPMAMGPISIAMSGMQPIKIGIQRPKDDEGFVAGSTSARNLLEDDEEVDDKDTVLLSRGKSVVD
jgi:hypothetical protein